jgi:hypothetical protein
LLTSTIFLVRSTPGNISRQHLIGFYDSSFIQSGKRDTARIFLNDLACRPATADPPYVAVTHKNKIHGTQ